MLPKQEKKWYDKTWVVVILCLTIFPIGIFRLWKSSDFPRSFKIAATAFLVIFFYKMLIVDSSSLTPGVIFFYLLLFAIMGFFIWLSEQGNKAFFGTLAILLILFLGLTLPFHYVPNRGKVFAKENLTFSNTIITESDISDLITRHNKASIFEKAAINNEPLVRKLMQEHILVEKNKENEEENK